MKIYNYYSPNFNNKKRPLNSIKTIIIHYTGMQSERESIKKLCSPKSKVSCHYLINRNGQIFNLVKDKNIAWHSGKSMWGKHKNLNNRSLGIELVNKGHRHGYQSFTKIQILKLIKLCKYLKKKYRIKNKFILGHSDIAPLRKVDPGEKFPWSYLSLKGIGIYPKKIKKKKIKPYNIRVFYKNLYKIGYRYLEVKFQKKIIKNFQRKFRQKRVDGVLDQETINISEILAKKPNIA